MSINRNLMSVEQRTALDAIALGLVLSVRSPEGMHTYHGPLAIEQRSVVTAIVAGWAEIDEAKPIEGIGPDGWHVRLVRSTRTQ